MCDQNLTCWEQDYNIQDHRGWPVEMQRKTIEQLKQTGKQFSEQLRDWVLLASGINLKTKIAILQMQPLPIKEYVTVSMIDGNVVVFYRREQGKKS